MFHGSKHKIFNATKNAGPLANNSALTDPDGNANNVFPARRLVQ